MVTVVVAGGGTGGHVYPALAIADAIGDIARVVYVGDPDRLEGRVVPKEGLAFVPVRVPMTPISRWRYPAFAFSLGRATATSIRLLRRERPDLVVGVGGFVSVPTMIAALLTRTPTTIHEQNVRPGRANRLMTRLGVEMMATFAGTSEFVPAKRFVLTGCPVRPAISSTGREEARRDLDLPAGARVCLVIGGSNGAVTLNEAALALGSRLGEDPELIVLHVSGRRYHDEMLRRRERVIPDAVRNRYRLVAYADDVASCYASADLVVSRSGSSTVNEILSAGRASVLSPSPNVAEDHQTANARFVAAEGAALVVESEDGVAIAEAAWPLLHDAERRARMERAALKTATGSQARDAVRKYIAARLERAGVG